MNIFSCFSVLIRDEATANEDMWPAGCYQILQKILDLGIQWEIGLYIYNIKQVYCSSSSMGNTGN